MSTNLALSKLCVCAAAGALIGGTAVHMVEQPKKKPRAAMVRPVSKPAAAPVTPLPCEPLMVQAPQMSSAAPDMGHKAYMALRPASSVGPIQTSSSALPDRVGDDAGTSPVSVPEPGMLGLLGSGLLGLVTLRWAARRRV